MEIPKEQKASTDEVKMFLTKEADDMISNLSEVKKMIVDYKYKFPSKFELLYSDLMGNIDINIYYIEKLFLIEPTKDNIDNLFDDCVENIYSLLWP